MTVENRTLLDIGNLGFSYFPIILIQDDSGNWVNLAEFGDYYLSGVDRLMSVGSISTTVEKDFEALSSSIQSVVLDNGDGFFDRPFPSDLRTAVVLHPAANFQKTVKQTESVLIGKKCQILVVLRVNGMGYGFSPATSSFSYVEHPLGTFIIDDLETDVESGKAILRLRGLQTELDDVDAGKVKNGISSYEYRPAAFLVEELLKLRFRTVGTNMIPAAFALNRDPNISTLDGSLVPSVLGQPPQYETSTREWKNLGLLTRAIVWRNGYLYCGCDGQIWKYSPTTDGWALVNNTTINGTLSGAKIRWMDYDGTTYIWGVAMVDAFTPNGSFSTVPCHRTIFFRIDASDNVVVLFGEEGRALSGLYQYRIGLFVDGDSYQDKNHWTFGQLDPFSVSNLLNIDAGEAGENIAIPFAQRIALGIQGNLSLGDSLLINRVRHGQHLPDASIFGKTDLNVDVKDETSPFITAARGYYSIDISAANGVAWHGLWHSIGQKHQFVRLQSYICGFRYNISSLKQEAFAMSLSNGARTSTPTTFRISNGSLIVAETEATCMCAYNTSGILIAFTSFENDGAGQISPAATLQLFSIPTFTAQASYAFTAGATGNDVYWTVVDLVRTQVGAIYGILYNRKKQTYALVRNLDTNSFASVVFIKESVTALRNLYYDPASIRVYCFEAGGKIIATPDASGNNNSYMYLMDGSPVVNNEGNMLSNFTSNSNGTAIEIYGISAPEADPELFGSVPSGKYVLFRVANRLTTRVELADFSDMSGWEAINKVAQAIRYIAGFDVDGNFFFLPRESSQSSVVYTVGEPNESFLGIPALSITKLRNRKEIFNVCKAVPGTVKDNPPEAQLTLVPRTENETTDVDETDSSGQSPFTVDQRDNVKKKVVAVCVQEGKSREANAPYGVNSLPLFKYSVFHEEIELYLRLSYSGGQSLYVNSIFGGDPFSEESLPQIGDYVSAVSDAGVIEYRKLIGFDTGDRIYISSAFSFTLEADAVITVLKVPSVDTSTDGKRSRWSDEGVTITNSNQGGGWHTVSSVRSLSVGTYVTFGDSTGKSSALQAYKIDQINEKTTWVHFEGLDITVPNGTRVNAYWCPEFSDELTEIGGSNVFVNFRPTSFKIGDTLRVDCPGLTVEEDNTSKQVAMNSESISLYGRREYPSISNRFLSRYMALEIAKRVINTYKDPHYLIQVVLPLTPMFSITRGSVIVRYQVFSPKLFPMYTSNVCNCVATSITHDLKNGRTTLNLRAIDSY